MCVHQYTKYVCHMCTGGVDWWGVRGQWTSTQLVRLPYTLSMLCVVTVHPALVWTSYVYQGSIKCVRIGEFVWIEEIVDIVTKKYWTQSHVYIYYVQPHHEYSVTLFGWLYYTIVVHLWLLNTMCASKLTMALNILYINCRKGTFSEVRISENIYCICIVYL